MDPLVLIEKGQRFWKVYLQIIEVSWVLGYDMCMFFGSLLGSWKGVGK